MTTYKADDRGIGGSFQFVFSIKKKEKERGKNESASQEFQKRFLGSENKTKLGYTMITTNVHLYHDNILFTLLALILKQIHLFYL